MNLLFITGCLEPGRDGVGDYSVRLATECVRFGHSCTLLAVNDTFIDEVVESRKAGLVLLRLPSHLKKNQKIYLAKQFVLSCSPDWINLQFVSYAFQSRGINWQLPRLVKEIRPLNCKFHIMFHELWIGEARKDSMMKRITGVIQKYFILRLIRESKPNTITTSLPVFKKMLELNGVDASLLPLFSNIPIVKENNHEWIDDFFSINRIDIKGNRRNGVFVAVLFGSLHNSWPHTNIFNELIKMCEKANKQLAIVSIGRRGPHNKWEALCEEYEGKISFLDFGERASNDISSLLSWADVGISPIPMMVLGKSGTYAAMKDHGLPVFCNQEPTVLRFPHEIEVDSYSNLFLINDREAGNMEISDLKKVPQTDGLQNIQRLFIDYLNLQS